MARTSERHKLGTLKAARLAEIERRRRSKIELADAQTVGALRRLFDERRPTDYLLDP